jgi:hypothetical protein
MAKELTVAAEIERLTAIYQELPPKRFALAQGLIAEAARLRVRCNKLWEDLHENGEVELFSQGDQDPYERERPSSRIYTAANKSYQSIIKQLNDMIPKDTETVGGLELNLDV